MTPENIIVNVELQNGHSRLDKYLVPVLIDLTRSKIQKLIVSQSVKVNDKIVADASFHVKDGDVIEINKVTQEPTYSIEAEKIDFEIVFEDEHILVINKPIGISVHPGAGIRSGTLVNAIAYHLKDTLPGDPERPGIVHRLDKDTSGLMVVAKSEIAHQKLSSAIAERRVKRVYNALIYGVPVPAMGTIDTPYGRSKVDRQKMTVKFASPRNAVTHYSTLKIFSGCLSLVELQLETGRTHQIRVHMEFRKTPLVGDKTYGKARNHNLAAFDDDNVKLAIRNFPRQALHAKRLEFDHPVSGDHLAFELDLPVDMKKLINSLS